jgi:cell division protein FtsB
VGEEIAPNGAVVLGMHRSGTSAFAGLLTKAGFYAGRERDLLAPAKDNPTGFFERLDVNALNDKLMAEAGGTWDNPPARSLVLDRAPTWRPKVGKLLDRLLHEAGKSPLLLKDPRVSVLLPAWLPALGHRFNLVVVDRNPTEVAMSVRKRDGRPFYVALALWQLYCTEMLDGLAGQRVWVARYEDLLRDPAGQTAALLDALGKPEAAGRDPASFVSADLRHQTPELDTERLLTGGQLALWRWLCTLPGGWVTLDPPGELRAQPEDALVAVNEHYALVADRNGLEVAFDEERHRALHFEQATELKEHHIELIEAELRRLRRDAASQSTRLEELETATRALEGLQAENAALQDQLRALREDSRAAAANLVQVAKRSWRGRGRARVEARARVDYPG